MRGRPILRRLTLIISAILVAAAADVAAASQDIATLVTSSAPSSSDRPTAPELVTKTKDGADRTCVSPNPRNILVCGKRGQEYRVDPDVMQANREVQTNERSATSATPPAQAVCSRQPVRPPPGCGEGLGSLDLVNVAIVVGTTAVRAAKGEDWKGIFRPGGADEYQLYQQAKRERDARDAERAAAAVRAKAREAEREANTVRTSSNSAATSQ